MLLTLLILTSVMFFQLDSTIYNEDYTDPVDFTFADAIPCDVKYKLFNKPHDVDGHCLDEDNIKIIKIDKTRPTIFLIHGYRSNDDCLWYEAIKDAYFQIGSRNIIYVDWSKAASFTYAVAAANTKPIGRYIADMILSSKIPLEKIHLVGHSLGAHVAGFAGKCILRKTKKQISRITAADPARIRFENKFVTRKMRLSDQDAVFVDVIHTDAGHYGFEAPVGTIDFYPNGGIPAQPGCPLRFENDDCSHMRSVWLFAESITTDSLKAKPCKSWTAYQEGRCNSNKEVSFGENVSRKAHGKSFLITNKNPPYLKKVHIFF